MRGKFINISVISILGPGWLLKVLRTNHLRLCWWHFYKNFIDYCLLSCRLALLQLMCTQIIWDGLKCRFRFSRSEWHLRLCISKKLPVDTDNAGP